MEIKHHTRNIIQNKYNTFGKWIFDQVLKADILIFSKKIKPSLDGSECISPTIYFII